MVRGRVGAKTRGSDALDLEMGRAPGTKCCAPLEMTGRAVSSFIPVFLNELVLTTALATELPVTTA